MKKHFRLLLPLMLAIAVLYVFGVFDRDVPPMQAPQTMETLAVAAPAVVPKIPPDAVDYVEYHFRNSQRLDEHYEKHGLEMGYASAKEYEKAASDVANNPQALQKLQAEDGDRVYFVEDTNDFVVISSDGFIRTYFRTVSGLAYFNQQ